jgi:hypothetical protein
LRGKFDWTFVFLKILVQVIDLHDFFKLFNFVKFLVSALSNNSTTIHEDNVVSLR